MSLHASSPILQTQVEDIEGRGGTLAAYEGKVMLIVNVASHCGYTPQYAGLEALYLKYKDRGLVVLGFPCNQFGAQESGTLEEIKSFCTANYGVTFPLFAKIEVNGPGRHPLYAALAGDGSPFPGDIGWNFTKFLVDRDGRVAGRFASGVKPDASELVAAIEKALGG
ncbi:MAG: glutathione peroxidase [Opitutaceae bacterium]|nr:glutathione peroxidase [Opitutaceae bacterium]